MARDTTGKFSKRTEEAGAATLDDIKMESMFTDALASTVSTLDIKKIAIKFAIGWAYAITAYIASFHIASIFVLMTSMVWLQYVIVFVVLMACFVFAIKTAPLVANGVYDAGAYVGEKAVNGYHAAKAWLANRNVIPSFTHGTTH